MPNVNDDDDGVDPFDTDVELPDPAIPALPPLEPLQHQHEEQQQQEGEQDEQHQHQPTTAAATATTAATTPTKQHRPLTKSYKSTLTFKTDLSKSSRESHPCGILHCTRGSTSGGSISAEEHAFAWIAHHDIPQHLSNALGHMEKFGFSESNVTFIPYSSRRSWIEKYPLAFPHVYCGGRGEVSGFPYWSGGGMNDGRGISIAGVIGSGGSGSGAMAAAAAGGGGGMATMLNIANTSTTPRSTAGRKKKKIFPTAHLPNDERDELHVEIYRYFQWLQTSLGGGGGDNDVDNNMNKKPSGGAGAGPAGINVTALRSLMENMESTFKVVRNAGPSSSSAAASAAAGGVIGTTTALPFLEEVLGEPLGRLVEVSKKDPEKQRSRASRSRGLDFDDMFDRLLQYQQAHGHVNVPQKYPQDGQLGSWVANMRSKRKQMAKKGEEFELDILPGDDDGGDDDDDVLGLVENDQVGGEGGGKKRGRRGGGGRQRLTRDRIHRLDMLGFQWVVANPNTKSWEERFEDLKEYQQLHGTTRVPRSSGTLGEWVHMQRRLHNKKDKNFLARKAPLLEDIGFEWHPRKHALVSWDDNFNRLVEFGRINRHYTVQSPFPEGYIGDYEAEDGELVEAHRFHKWVKRIHAEYRAYASGKGSRMLNEARVMQLREIGFQFI
ncbi:hypothetical protein ACHAXR_005173 [Thalassiosira sp. AJA248-18]